MKMDEAQPREVSKAQLSHLQSRVIGALLGVHVGDSLGAGFEFMSHAEVAINYPSRFRDILGGGSCNWPPGHATDDTDLTRAVLLAYRDSILSNEVPSGPPIPIHSLVPQIASRAGHYFVEWFDGKTWPGRDPPGSRPKDIGSATYTGIRNFKRNPNYPSGAGQGSAGNGSLMRAIPTALFQPDPSRLLEESEAISAITHDDTRCTVACAAYNVCAAALIAGASPIDAVKAAEKAAIQLEEPSLESGPGHAIRAEWPVTTAIRTGRKFDLASAASRGPPDDILPGGGSGFVLESLIIAIGAVLDPRSFEDVLVDVVRLGKDTDTNAAIAGGLLGARDGDEAIPKRWKNVLQFGAEFQHIALEILDIQRQSKS